MIMNRIFYAFKNVKVPLIVAGASIVSNFFLDWLLSRFFDVGGLALSTSFVAAINVAILLAILRKNIGQLGAKRILKSYSKIFLSAAVMGISIYFGWKYIYPVAQRSNILYLLSLAAVIVGSAGIYLFCTFLFKMDEIKFLLGSIKQRTRR
jgi:putative peptidoglycan lipid II flippase